MQNDYKRVAAKVDKELFIWSDSDEDFESDADSDGSAVSGGEKKTHRKGAGVKKKNGKKTGKKISRRGPTKRKAGKGAGGPSKKSDRRVPTKRKADRKPKRKAGGKRKRKAGGNHKRKAGARAPASPVEKPAREPSAEVRQELDHEATQIKILLKRKDRRLKDLEGQVDKLDASHDRASWNEQPDIKARRIFRNLSPENADGFVKGLITWIYQKDNRALQQITGGQWRELAFQDAKKSRDKIVGERDALRKRQFVHSQKVEMLQDLDKNIEENPAYTWHDLYSLTGYDPLFLEIMPKPSVSRDNLIPDESDSTDCEAGESDEDWYNLSEPGAEPAAEESDEPGAAAAAVDEPEPTAAADGTNEGYCGSVDHIFWLKDKRGADGFQHMEYYVQGVPRTWCAQNPNP